MRWLVKEEPANYPFSQFVEDGTTIWSGVRNPVAQKNLRAMKPGDKVFYYHTGNEKAVVGIAKAVGNAYADPADRTGKAHVVELVPVKPLPRPVTLDEIKADKRFAKFPLTYLPRLSVMPVSETDWSAILKLSARPTAVR